MFDTCGFGLWIIWLGDLVQWIFMWSLGRLCKGEENSGQERSSDFI